MSEVNQIDTSLWPSVNQLANPLVAKLIANAKALRLEIGRAHV